MKHIIRIIFMLILVLTANPLFAARGKITGRIINTETDNADAGALGVKWYSNGISNDCPNIVFLNINGASGTAGELISLRISLPEITKLIETAKKGFSENQSSFEMLSNDESVFLSRIVEGAKKNDPVSRFLLQNICKNITKVIIHIVEFLNPNLIVIGGDIVIAEFLINDYILPSIRKQSTAMFHNGISFPKIVFSKYCVSSVALGSTVLIFKKNFISSCTENLFRRKQL